MNFGAFLSVKDHVFPSNSPQIFPMKKVTKNPPGIHSKTKVGGLDLFETLEHMRKIPVWTPRKERSVLGVFGDLGDRSSKGRFFFVSRNLAEILWVFLPS